MPTKIGLAEGGLYALLGYAVVFAGLIALMFVTILFGKLFSRKKEEKVSVPAAETEVAAPVVAPGAAGQLKLYNVEPKTAAMLMAIVADKMGKPINELRFLSIKEVTE